MGFTASGTTTSSEPIWKTGPPAIWEARSDSRSSRAHLIVDVIRLADRQRHDRQGRIGSPGARELATVADEQVLDVVGLTPPVADAVGGFGAHPQRAHVVTVGKWRAPYQLLRVTGLENRFQSLAGMLQHLRVVRVILDRRDIGDGQAGTDPWSSCRA